MPNQVEGDLHKANNEFDKADAVAKKMCDVNAKY